MNRWRCIICGYIHTGEQPPVVCPICNAPQRMFECLDCGDDSVEGEEQA